MPGHVDHQLANHHLGSLRYALKPGPERRPHSREQLVDAERLHHIVVGAELEAQHAIHLLVLGGEEDHRHVGLLAEPP